MSLDEARNKGFWEKIAANPWVPLGSLATAAVLGSGIFAFYKGKTGMSQSMMRLRVVAQGLTIVALIVGTSTAGIDFAKKREPKFVAEDKQ